MKITSKLILFSMLFTSLTHANDHTMFIPRLLSTDQIFELGVTNYQFHHTHKTNTLAFKPFFQQSHAAKNLARFFLPQNKACVTVRENGSGDINSLWLQLISPPNSSYASTLSLKPQRTSGGIVFTYYADLSMWLENLWFGINSALVHTKHNLHVCESDSAQNGTLPGITNACEALNNSTWQFGKLSCKARTRTGLDDIQLKLGYTAIDTARTYVAPYAVMTIPTGTRPQAHYLFEPLVGSKHCSLGLGLNTDFKLNHNVSFMMDAKYNYVFGSGEHRSFDLKNGDWSRYLLVVTQAQPLFVYPAINSLTKKVHVTPGSTFQFWGAMHYQRHQWHTELGYNLWVRGSEKVRIKSCSVTVPCTTTPIGILDMIRICNLPATTASTAQISQGIVPPNVVVSDAAFTPIKISDLNICSATNPTAVSNTLYGSLGYQSACYPLLVALNGSYEFTNSCGAISQYALWGTLEVQF